MNGSFQNGDSRVSHIDAYVLEATDLGVRYQQLGTLPSKCTKTRLYALLMDFKLAKPVWNDLSTTALCGLRIVGYMSDGMNMAATLSFKTKHQGGDWKVVFTWWLFRQFEPISVWDIWRFKACPLQSHHLQVVSKSEGEKRSLLIHNRRESCI